MTIDILLAKRTAAQAEPIKKLIELTLNQNLARIELKVTEVRTLAELKRLAPQYAHPAISIIITGLNLEDAGPDEIIAAIPTLPEPVLVVTDLIDADIHFRCRMARAFVVNTNTVKYADLCTAITNLLSQALIQSVGDPEK